MTSSSTTPHKPTGPANPLRNPARAFQQMYMAQAAPVQPTSAEMVALQDFAASTPPGGPAPGAPATLAAEYGVPMPTTNRAQEFSGFRGDPAVQDRVRAAHPEVVGDGRVQAWVVGSGSDADAGWAFHAASLSWPSFLASSAARSATSRSRAWSKSSSARVRSSCVARRPPTHGAPAAPRRPPAAPCAPRGDGARRRRARRRC